MVKLSDIIEKLSDIQLKTLRVPTHILVSKKTADELLDQYSDIVNSDADMVYQVGESFNLRDVGDFLGVNIAISIFKLDGFKILEEVTSNS